jgi:succinate dehydrogenase flavin-adding protein (antitoxin of CptAB toxin-antitoxin module)
MKELDLLLERWLRCEYERASPLLRERFTALLELPDPDLVAYLLGHGRPTSPDIAAAVHSVLSAGGIMSSSASNAEPSSGQRL